MSSSDQQCGRHESCTTAGGFDGFYTYFASTGFSDGARLSEWPRLSSWAREHKKIFVPCVGALDYFLEFDCGFGLCVHLQARMCVELCVGFVSMQPVVGRSVCMTT